MKGIHKLNGEPSHGSLGDEGMTSLGNGIHPAWSTNEPVVSRFIHCSKVACSAGIGGELHAAVRVVQMCCVAEPYHGRLAEILELGALMSLNPNLAGHLDGQTQIMTGKVALFVCESAHNTK